MSCSGIPQAFWAAVPENSFLATDEETRRDLAAAGFEVLTFHDTTQATMSANAAMRQKMQAEGLPPTGMHVLMGERFLQLQINSLRAMEDGRTITVEMVATKPA